MKDMQEGVATKRLGGTWMPLLGFLLVVGYIYAQSDRFANLHTNSDLAEVILPRFGGHGFTC